MNRLAFPLFSLASLLLLSCTPPQQSGIDYDLHRKSETRSVAHYALVAEDGLTKAEEQGSVTLSFVQDEPLVPYISLTDYAHHFSYLLNPLAKTAVSRNGNTERWTISNPNGGLLFTVLADYDNLEFTIGGSAYSAKKSQVSVESSLMYQLDLRGSYIQGSGSSRSVLSFAKVGLYPLEADDGEIRLPLGLLDITFSEEFGAFTSYDYSHLITYEDYASTSESVTIGNETASVIEGMKAKASEVPPTYLLEYNRACFYYEMENRYGMKSKVGAESMLDYYRASAYDAKFLSSSSEERELALTWSLNILDDDHTALVNACAVYGEDKEPSFPRGVNSQLRRVSKSALSELRLAARGENNTNVSYSSSQKTAFFSFDGFTFAREKASVIDPKTNTFLPDAYLSDTYALFRRCFDDIKTHQGVQSVVIDLSLNGGGTVGVLMKLLAYLSQNDSATLDFLDTLPKTSIRYTARVDVNGDEKYDASDCVGDDYDIYLLTSRCSYSCANAMPFLAQKQGIAKILGETSGGGECTVQYRVLPNLQRFAHSTTDHIGHRGASFEGDEDGASPDIPLEYASFYDLEKLETAIVQYRS